MENLQQYITQNATSTRYAETLHMLVACCIEFYALPDAKRATVEKQCRYTTSMVKKMVLNDSMLPPEAMQQFSYLLNVCAHKAYKFEPIQVKNPAQKKRREKLQA